MKKMSRVRRKKIQKTKRKILKNIIYLIVGFAWFIKLAYELIEKIILLFFKKMPKWAKRLLIIMMILLSLIGIKSLTEEEKVKEVIKKEVETLVITKEIAADEQNSSANPAEEVAEKIAEETSACKYNETECLIYNEAIEQGLSDEFAKISIAISKWETGNFTSNLFVNSYNFGGLYNGKTKSFYRYNNLEEGVEAFISNLKNGYFDKGLTTIEKIQKKYCPVGAANDPTNLNCNWINGVTYFYNQL